MKRIKISKKKLVRNIRIVLIAIILLLSVVLLPSTYSRFSSLGESSATIDVAFSLLNTDELIKSISLGKISPDNTVHSLLFDVLNYDDNGNRIDVNLNYYMVIKMTTNIPLSLELVDDKDKKININEELKTDEHGTYFRYLTTDTQKIRYDKNYVDHFKLKYSLSNEYSDYTYQDLIEMVSIEIHAEQII